MHIFHNICLDINNDDLSVQNLDRKERIAILKYYNTLIKLDDNINNLDVISKVRAEFQNSINYTIENRLYDRLINQVDKPYTIELIKYETSRLKEENKHIKRSKVYYSNMLRCDARGVLSTYMKIDEIPERLLNYYPKTMEELLQRNDIKSNNIAKTKKLETK